MMTDIPFGIAEIDGEAVSVIELSFAEVASFNAFVSNNKIIFDMIQSLDFSGTVPILGFDDKEETTLFENFMLDDYVPSKKDISLGTEMFDKWMNSFVPIGIKSLNKKGLLLADDENKYKAHRSLDNILKILNNPMEHIAYKTLQVAIEDTNSKPVLRSSLYAVQSTVGDWLIAEHFQSHDYIRFFSINVGGNLSHKINKIVSKGVERSINSSLFSGTGIEYRPYSIFISKTNSHGARIVASSQSIIEDGISQWYVPYNQRAEHSLLGEITEKFNNSFVTNPDVAQIASVPYTQLDIRNGLEGWSRVGDQHKLINEVANMTKITLHSQADHLPDTIPDFFFEQDKDIS